MNFSVPTVRVKSGDSFATINESDFDASKHQRFAEPLPPPPPPPGPPPPPPGPLASLPADWRSKSPQELRAFAQTLTGRMPENKAQAVDVIAAELAKAGK